MEKPWLALLLCLAICGCNNKSSSSPGDSGKRASNDQQLELSAPGRVHNSISAPNNSADVQQNLLAMRLTPEQLEQGWVRLYDGMEMTGWFFMGSANWQYGGGILSADGGEPSLFCTSFQISDFELSIDFNCAEGTDSAILLRTSTDPRDLQRDAIQLSIAPPTSDYPTGSLVQRKKCDDAVSAAPNQWHTYRIVCQGDQVDVTLDDQPIMHYTDSRHLGRGYIGLQYNQGVIRFRNILMRPLGSQSVAVDNNWETTWNKLDRSGSMKFQVEPSEEGIRLLGGPGQLESKDQWSDFVLQAKYQVASEAVDSGILFRCLPERFNEGYECQIFHGLTEKRNRKQQTGALSIPFKNELVNARVLASDGLTPTYLTIIADESQFTSFVNGVLVADVADIRELSPNPRVGCRREAGTVALQAPDEATDIMFQRIDIAPMRKR